MLRSQRRYQRTVSPEPHRNRIRYPDKRGTLPQILHVAHAITRDYAVKLSRAEHVSNR